MENKIYPSMPQESVMKTYDKDGNLVSAVPVTYSAHGHGHAQPLPGGPSYDWGDPPRYSSSSDDSSNYQYNDYYTSYGGAAATVGFDHVGFTAVSKRNFTIKVLLTVTAMVSVMIGMTFWFLYDYSIGCYLTSEWWLYYVFTLAVPLVGLVIFCSDTLTRRWPLNLFVLIFWTFIMSTGYAFLANLWAVNGYDGICKAAFCTAEKADCELDPYLCVLADNCSANAAGTMGISLGVVAVVLLIGVCLAICKIDIYDIGWPLQVIFILLLLPCGFIGLIFLPYEWYFGFVCSLMIYVCVIGIWKAMYMITADTSRGGFHQDEWVRAAMYIFHLERSSFDYFVISLEESFLERPCKIGNLFTYMVGCIGLCD